MTDEEIGVLLGLGLSVVLFGPAYLMLFGAIVDTITEQLFG